MQYPSKQIEINSLLWYKSRSKRMVTPNRLLRRQTAVLPHSKCLVIFKEPKDAYVKAETSPKSWSLPTMKVSVFPFWKCFVFWSSTGAHWAACPSPSNVSVTFASVPETSTRTFKCMSSIGTLICLLMPFEYFLSRSKVSIGLILEICLHEDYTLETGRIGMPQHLPWKIFDELSMRNSNQKCSG